MEAVMMQPRQSYVFDHKLTDEEIRDLIDSYDYDPSGYKDDGGAIWDEFGNPTEATIRAKYETEHGLAEQMTLDEFFAELDGLRAEAENEDN